MEKMEHISIKHSTKTRLDELKEYPRETYGDIIERITPTKE